jgi:hypothetical protein
MKRSTAGCIPACRAALSIKARESQLPWPRSPLARVGYSPRERQ